MKLPSLLGITLLLCGVMSCSEDPAGPQTQTTTPPQTLDTGIYTVSGKLRFNKARTIPADVRVLVFWVVSSGSPDYVYVSGEGRVNLSDSTFRVAFKTPPPDQALNQYDFRLGVGMVVLTTNRTITEGKYSGQSADSILQSGFLGGAPDYGVIYIQGNPTPDSWPAKFGAGFSVGRGVRKAPQLDEFEPADSSNVEMDIDDLSALHWVNWT